MNPVNPFNLVQKKFIAMKRPKLFAIIELIVAVVIIVILTAKAIPAYNDYVKNSKVAEVKMLWADIKVFLEKYYVAEGRYPTTEQVLRDEAVKLEGTYVTNGIYTSSPSPCVCFELDWFNEDTGYKMGWCQLPDTKPVKWSCKLGEFPADFKFQCQPYLDEKYLPESCKL